ncbi:hypothetical protein [Antarctobacter heliothermus]|uniref:Glycosyl transferase family 2 n=1 Tax=Antarctobacter heliothermus TaxID=74033 RepID=A0A239I413_9RHOB|nr:hypothetical protein [Antarctobacter heliothermus]SNS87813.1 hypothetical protein SAMN04488078_10392 [Antarctobacter heliothermus]
MSDFATLSLNGSGLMRAPRVRPAKRAEGYLDRFDATTLWLDAIWQDGSVILICPRLNNLKRAVAAARFTVDGAAVRPRLAQYCRHTLIRLPAPSHPENVAVRIGDWQGTTVVHDRDTRLDGCNVLMTLSKDNHPDWIEDWGRFHIAHHGADAVLFVDNGSATWGPDQIRPALERAGFRQIVLLSTPLRYGPRGLPPFLNAELFLQTGVLNALQFRFLHGARAVLNCDVDELVMTPGRTVFDAAVNSRFGFVSFPGRWVHPAPETDGWPAHAGHTHHDAPRKTCPPKWCIVPGGPLRGFQWRAHGLERLPLRRMFQSPNAWFYHCRNMALLRKVGNVRSSPFPGRNYPTGSVTGMPSAV